MRITCKSLKNLVDVTGIEPATPCLQRLDARRINYLHGVRLRATNYYKYFLHGLLAGEIPHSVALGRAWSWAQKWAQPRDKSPARPQFRADEPIGFQPVIGKTSIDGEIVLLCYSTVASKNVSHETLRRRPCLEATG